MIYNQFKLADTFSNKPLSSFHLAEGPGGFIEDENNFPDPDSSARLNFQWNLATR